MFGLRFTIHDCRFTNKAVVSHRLLSALLAFALTLTSTPVWAMPRLREALVPKSAHDSQRVLTELTKQLGTPPAAAQGKGRQGGGSRVGFMANPSGAAGVGPSDVAPGAELGLGAAAGATVADRLSLEAAVSAGHDVSAHAVTGDASSNAAFVRPGELSPISGPTQTTTLDAETRTQLETAINAIHESATYRGVLLGYAVDVLQGAEQTKARQDARLQLAVHAGSERHASLGFDEALKRADTVITQFRQGHGGQPTLAFMANPHDPSSTRGSSDAPITGSLSERVVESEVLAAGDADALPTEAGGETDSGHPVAKGSPLAVFDRLRNLTDGEGLTAAQLAGRLRLKSATIDHDLRALRALGLLSLIGRTKAGDDRFGVSRWVRAVAKRADGSQLMQQLDAVLAGFGHRAEDVTAIDETKPNVQNILSMAIGIDGRTITPQTIGQIVDRVIVHWREGRTSMQGRWGWGINRLPITLIQAELALLFPEATIDEFSRTRSVDEFKALLVREFEVAEDSRHLGARAFVRAQPQPAAAPGAEAPAGALTKEQLEERFGARLNASDESVITDLVAYRDSLNTADPGRQVLYDWLSNHDSVLAAEKAIEAIGLNWPGVVAKLVALIRGERQDGNPRAAARQLKELAEESTYGGLNAPAGVVAAARRAWKDLSRPERDLAKDVPAPKSLPAVAPGVRPGVLLIVQEAEHGWSRLRRWIGWHDAKLTAQGRKDAYERGRALRMDGIRFDRGFASALSRSSDTLEEFLRGFGQPDLTVQRLPSLNDRAFGDLTGWGHALLQRLFPRLYEVVSTGGWLQGYRGNAVRPPGGENLQDVQERLLPDFLDKVMGAIARGENVVVSAQGRSRQVIMAWLWARELGQTLTEDVVRRVDSLPLFKEDAPSNINTPIVCTFDRALRAKQFVVAEERTGADVATFLNVDGYPEVRVAQAIADDELLDTYAQGDTSVDRRQVNEAMGRRLASLTITTPAIVETSVANGVGTITLRRGRMNDFDEQLLAALYQAWEKLDRDPTVKTITVTGASGQFSAGADIKQLNERRLNTRYVSAMGQTVFRRIAETKKVKIGAMTGFALGGGYELAQALDYLIASPTAKLGQPEITLGVIPGWGGTQRLARRLSNTLAAAKLCLSGEFVDGRRAFIYGMVDEVAENPLAAAMALARRVADDPNPETVRERLLAEWLAAREQRTSQLERLADGQALREHPHIKYLMKVNGERWQGVAGELILRAVEEGSRMLDEVAGEELEAQLFAQAMATPMAEWILEDFGKRQRRPFALPALLGVDALPDVPATREQWVIDQYATVGRKGVDKKLGGKATQVMHRETLDNEPIGDYEVRIKWILASVAESNAGRQLPGRDPIDQLEAHRQEWHGPGNVLVGVIGERGRLVPNLPHLQLGAEVVTHNAAFADVLDRGVIRGDATMDVKVVGYDESQIDPSAPRRKIGAYATSGIAHFSTVMPKPEHLTYEEAASYLLAYPTIYHNFRRNKVGKGSTVFLVGIAGGTGTAAVQYGKMLGVRRMIGTVSMSPEEARAFEQKYSDAGFEVKVINRLEYDLSKPTEVERFVARVTELNDGVPVDVALDFQGEFFPDALLKSVKAGEIASSIVSGGNETWYGAEQKYLADIHGVAGAASLKDMLKAVVDLRDLPDTKKVAEAAYAIFGDTPEIRRLVQEALDRAAEDRAVHGMWTYGADGHTISALHEAAEIGAHMVVTVATTEEQQALLRLIAATPALRNVVPKDGILVVSGYLDSEGKLDMFKMGTKVRELLGGEKPDVILERADPQRLLGLPAGAHTLPLTFSAMLRSGGQVVFTEDTSGLVFKNVDLRRWVFQQDILFPTKRMIASHYASHTECWIVNEMVRKGLWPVDYPTKVYGFEDIPKGLEEQGRGKVVFLHGIPPGLRNINELLINSIGIKLLRAPSANPKEPHKDVSVALGPVIHGRFYRELTVTAGENVTPDVIAEQVKKALQDSGLPEAVQAAKVEEAQTIALHESARRFVAALFDDMSRPNLSDEERQVLQTAFSVASGEEQMNQSHLRPGDKALYDRCKDVGLGWHFFAHQALIRSAIDEVKPEWQIVIERASARAPWVEGEPAIGDPAALQALVTLMDDPEHPRTVLLEEPALASSPGDAILWQEALEVFRRRIWAREGHWVTLDEAARRSAAKLALHARPTAILDRMKLAVKEEERAVGVAKEFVRARIALWSNLDAADGSTAKQARAERARVDGLLARLTPDGRSLDRFLAEHFPGVSGSVYLEAVEGSLIVGVQVSAEDKSSVERAAQALLQQPQIVALTANPRTVNAHMTGLLARMNASSGQATSFSPSWLSAVTGPTIFEVLGRAQAVAGAPVVGTIGSSGWTRAFDKIRPATLAAAVKSIDVRSMRVYDSRGQQTLEVEIEARGKVGKGLVPSGASTGVREALELRDEDFAKAVEKGAAVFALIDKAGVVHVSEAEAIQWITDGKATTSAEAVQWLRAHSSKGTRVAQLRAAFLLRELQKAVERGEVDVRIEHAVNRWLERMETQFGGDWERKNYFGANAILAISAAAFRLAAALEGVEPYAYHPGPYPVGQVIFQANILNGGEHADNKVDIQETMITVIPDPNATGPHAIRTEADAIEVGAQLFLRLKAKLKKAGLNTNVGDEGGFAPNVLQNAEYLRLAVETVLESPWAGVFGRQIGFCLDPAFSERSFEEKGQIFYWLEGETNRKGKPQRIRLSDGRQIGTVRSVQGVRDGKPLVVLTSAELTAYWRDLAAQHPMISFEDGYDQNDISGYQQLTAWANQASKVGTPEYNELRFPIQRTLGIDTVGDDLLVTNLRQLIAAVEGGEVVFGEQVLKFPPHTINSILVKINQVGSIEETKRVIAWALAHGISVKISHRSGETEDTLIADIAKWATTLPRSPHPVSGRMPLVWIKTGSFSRSDRLAKYNRLLKIGALEDARHGSQIGAPMQLPPDDPSVTYVGSSAELPEAIRAQYTEGAVDQNLKPIVVYDGRGPVGRIQPGDLVFFGNIRSDRAIELTRSLIARVFTQFERGVAWLLGGFYSMSNYRDEFEDPSVVEPAANVVVRPARVSNYVPEVFSRAGWTVFLGAESQKKNHVPGRFYRGVDEPLPNEVDRVVKSLKPASRSFTDAPAMRADAVSDATLAFINTADGTAVPVRVDESATPEERAKDESRGSTTVSEKRFITINYANFDMVGHDVDKVPGVIDGTATPEDVMRPFIEAARTLDRELRRVVAELEAKGYTVVITGDHGNGEKVIKDDGTPLTLHTNHKVPVHIIGRRDGQPLQLAFKDEVEKVFVKRRKGTLIVERRKGAPSLANIAATLLDLAGLAKPDDYSESLLADPSQVTPSSKVAMIVCDGYGSNPNPNDPYDPLRVAHELLLKESGGTQGLFLFDIRQQYAYTEVNGGGEDVGLRADSPHVDFLHQPSPGNSDVGHDTLGSGRVVEGNIAYVDSLKGEDGAFRERDPDGTLVPETQPIFESIRRAIQERRRLHYLLLASEGEVHASLEHLYAYLRTAAKEAKRLNQPIELYIHGFTDGRDTHPRSGAGFIDALLEHIADIGAGELVTILTRDDAMDRDNDYPGRIKPSNYVLRYGRSTLPSASEQIPGGTLPSPAPVVAVPSLHVAYDPVSRSQPATTREMAEAQALAAVAAQPSTSAASGGSVVIRPSGGALAVIAKTVAQGNDKPPAELLQQHEMDVDPDTSVLMPRARPVSSTAGELVRTYEEGVGEL